MIDLDELKRLAGLVTPGEWSPDDNDDRDCAQVIVSDRFGFEIGDVFAGERFGECEANAALICRLRNNLPELIAALEVVDLVRDEGWLAERISDSLDVDWRPIDAARAIIAALPKETDNAHA